MLCYVTAGKECLMMVVIIICYICYMLYAICYITAGKECLMIVVIIICYICYMPYAIFYMLYHSWKGMFDDHCNNDMRECATGVEECEKLSNTESAGMAVACVCGSLQ